MREWIRFSIKNFFQGYQENSEGANFNSCYGDYLDHLF